MKFSSSKTNLPATRISNVNLLNNFVVEPGETIFTSKTISKIALNRINAEGLTRP